MTAPLSERTLLQAAMAGDLQQPLVDWERVELFRLRATLRRARLVFMVMGNIGEPNDEPLGSTIALLHGMARAAADNLEAHESDTREIQRRQAEQRERGEASA